MSEKYQALYRKWRPMTFEDVVGQSHITDTLKHELAAGKVGHAYLFCGTRGTGKTSTAKIFSRAVNCENPKNGEPCNECEICRGIIDGRIMDVYEIDAASNNGVDNIRDLREEVAYSPAGCKYKVYIIDEVHMLTTQAFNALLKTLEEPPEHALFILATTEPQKIPQTILSRCQRYDFKRIGNDDISKHLKKICSKEGINATEDAVELIAELGDGSMRDSLSILDRCASFGGEELRTETVSDIVGIVDARFLFDITESVADADVTETIKKIDNLLNLGKNVLTFFEDYIDHLRCILICKECDEPTHILEKSHEEIEKLKAYSEKFTSSHLIYSITTMSDYHAKAKTMTTPNIAAEVALIKLCKPSYSSEVDALCARIEKLENKLKGGAYTKIAPVLENKKETNVHKSAPTDMPPWDFAPDELKTINSTKDMEIKNEEKKAEPSAEAEISSGGKWSLWPEALDSIKNSSKKLYMYLYKCDVELNGDAVELEVSSKIAYDTVSTAKGLEYLSNLFTEIADKPLRALVFMQGQKSGAAKKKNEPSIMDLVKKKEQFGDIINIKGDN